MYPSVLMLVATLATLVSAAPGDILGDRQCVRDMCVTATINLGQEAQGSVGYELKVSKPKIGWMAIGFGSKMVDTPMVILYTNGTGSTVVSHRLAKSIDEPEVVSNPPRKAVAYEPSNHFDLDSSTLAFTIPANSDTRQPIIWAYSKVKPSPLGGIMQHFDKGTMVLNLAGSFGGGSQPAAPLSTPSIETTQNLVIAHGILLTIGFFFILPAGVLLARCRTLVNSWFRAHSILQSMVASLFIITGWIFAVVAVGQQGKSHFTTTHKKVGLLLFILYLVQVSLGTIIHYIKPKPQYGPILKHPAAYRPIQNYLHALLGLTILGLGFWQIATGFSEEWPRTQGQDPLPSGVSIFWNIWTFAFLFTYAVGLYLLKKQFSQERMYHEGRAKDEGDSASS